MEITGGSKNVIVEEGGDMELACDHDGEGWNWNICEWSREAGDLKCITHQNAEDKMLECERPDTARVIGTEDSCKVRLVKMSHGKIID